MVLQRSGVFMTFGLMVTADFFSSDQLVHVARQAEANGFSNLWVPEMFGRDPFITCATLLNATTGIHVGTAITNIYARDERAIKAAAYSLAESSNDRFELGLGVSNKVGNDQRGLPFLPPVKKLNAFMDRYEATELMFDHGAKRVPVYLAAHGPKLMQLAADRLDGAYTYMMPVAYSRQSKDRIGEGKLHLMQPTVFESDPALARKHARRAVSIYIPLENYHRAWREGGFADEDFANGGSDDFIDSLIAWGDQEQILARYSEQRAHGVDHIIMSPANLNLLDDTSWPQLADVIRAGS
jgi:probable F420-dependent oxidoreductase